MDVVEVLLSRGGNPTLATSHGLVPLMGSSSGGHLGIVKRLLSHEIETPINTRNVHGATAVWYACSNGHQEVAKLLLEAGADPTLAHDNGVSAIGIAGIKGHSLCVDLLKVSEAQESPTL